MIELVAAPGNYFSKRHTILPTKFPLTIYREIKVGSIDEINLRSVGRYWTEEVGYAESYNDEFISHDSEPRITVLLITKVNKDQIDWPATKKARQNKEFGKEREITLKSHTPLNIVIEYEGKHTKKKATAGSYTKDTLTPKEAEKLARLVAPLVKRVSRRFHIAGSFRRKKSVIGDLDFVATECNLGTLLALLTEKLGAIEAPRAGASVLTTIIPFNKKKIQVEFISVKDKAYGSALLHSTGSGEFNQGLRGYVKGKGLILSQHGLFDIRSRRWLAGSTEEDVFKYVGLNYIPPERRGEPFSKLKKEFLFDANKGQAPSLKKIDPDSKGTTWKVKSSKTNEKYLVRDINGRWSCTCKGFFFKGDCRHIKFVKQKRHLK